jgi:hypothetical protein
MLNQIRCMVSACDACSLPYREQFREARSSQQLLLLLFATCALKTSCWTITVLWVGLAALDLDYFFSALLKRVICTGESARVLLKALRIASYICSLCDLCSQLATQGLL